MTFEEKGEPKRIQTEVPLLTSLTPYRLSQTHGNGQTGSQTEAVVIALLNVLGCRLTC